LGGKLLKRVILYPLLQHVAEDIFLAGWNYNFAYFAVVAALLLSSCQVAYYPYPSWGADAQIQSDPDVQAAMEACNDFSSEKNTSAWKILRLNGLTPMSVV
jgi:hypothetical protein